MSLSTLNSQPSTTPHLVARDLRRSFDLGKRKIDVLRGISAEIQKGEAVFLCGASGAGKTTLLYTLAGLERPESGTVEFEGTRLYEGGEATQARIRNERIGFVFQGYFLLPELTALENAMMPSMIGRKIQRAAAEQALSDVGLAERFHHLPAELSGGEQQRVAIARALINDPSIIFADEPTGNLDSKTGEGIVELLLGLVRQRGKTLVVVTHDAHLATRGDRRLEIQDGLLVA
ncbi:ABC transporter-related protein [Chthoniobacter flavus Ellin428]|uniref:ABC transporter-related protein n=1 Tax=Chthoniobacter flavus Ellin428 TaxID=497964 RepID=B4D3F5_9BACT|nr:ABC transporter ATP-binding protein [Chthoniobacter flavus]EDY19266.1 ABC transporter-related protein [Chthoniobacter flavus Ellin428]TCO88108.1 putative ABC transport system ATP-binding protein/lipoprotein-releasing system ATP-binding protein [Chthoniobacter flavus]